MPEELGEKTELPTGRRLREARGRGQIPKSHDFGSAVDLIGAFIALSVLGGSIITGLAALFVTLRYWKAPGSLVQPQRWLMPTALVLASLQTLAYAALFGWLFFH